MYKGCGDGWTPLIEDAERLVNKYNLEHPQSSLKWVQIKEKYGGLRLYVDNYVPEIKDKLRQLENLSYYICEECGTNENVTTTTVKGYIRTLCDKCRKEFTI